MHALLALMRERGVEAVAVEVSAQALSRRRVDGIVFDVAGVHQPHPRSPRRLRRHARVLRGEAAALPARPRPARGDLARLGRRRSRSSPAARCPSSRSARPRSRPTRMRPPAPTGSSRSSTSDRPAPSSGSRHRDGRSLTTIVPVIGRHMAANAGLAIVMILEARLRVGPHRRRPRARRRHRRLPPRPHRAGLGRARPGRLRRLRPLPRRVREDARRRAARDARQGAHALRRRRRPRRDEASRHGSHGRGGQRHPRGHRPPPALREHRHDPRHPHRGRAPSATRCRDPRVLAARASRSSRPSSSSATATRSCGPDPDTRTTATSAGSARPYSARELARRALRDAGWPVPEPHWPVPYPPTDPSTRARLRPPRRDRAVGGIPSPSAPPRRATARVSVPPGRLVIRVDDPLDQSRRCRGTTAGPRGTRRRPARWPR